MIKLISFPVVQDKRGNLTFIQNSDLLPFELKRVYWIFDIPSQSIRGGHAFKKQQEIIIAISGSFNINIINKDNTTQTFFLNKSNVGLYIPNETWRFIDNFSTNAIILSLNSDLYNSEDYIYNLDNYLNNEKQ